MLTLDDINNALSVEDDEERVQVFAKIFRLFSEDLIGYFVKFSVLDICEDGSIVLQHPNGFNAVLAQLNDGNYECGIELDGSILQGGFALMNEEDIERVNSLFD